MPANLKDLKREGGGGEFTDSSNATVREEEERV